MVIFGTVGCFVRAILIPSATLAALRGAAGFLALLLILVISGNTDFSALSGQIGKIFVSGACLGLNWLFLFEAYRYTTVAIATLCYYMAPVLIFIYSVVFKKERQSSIRYLCMFLAVFGIILVSGVIGPGIIEGGKGMLLALGAACLYAAVVLTGKTITGVPAMQVTAAELMVAAIVLLPYTLIRGLWTGISWDSSTIILTACVCLIHTGLAYYLYFCALPSVPSGDAALLSYIDPSLAVLLSAFFLKEPISADAVAGGILILVCTVLPEIIEMFPHRYVTGQEEELLADRHRVTYYNDALCIRHPFKRFTSCANMFCIFLNGNRGDNRRFHADPNTVKHEYGHMLQMRLLGPFRFIWYIAFPSMKGYHKHVPYASYYNQPWERGADYLGGVIRSCHDDDSVEQWNVYLERILPRRKRKNNQ